jgi:RHS repeat-associated protein
VADISIGANGFTPAIYTVEVGLTVTWANNTGEIQVLHSGQPPTLFLPLVVSNRLSAGRHSSVSALPATLSEMAPAFPAAVQESSHLFEAAIPPGGTFTFTFPATGSVLYYLKNKPGTRGRVVVVEPGIPPDPSTVATPIDPTIATDIADANAFLYTGANPIQVGVAPGTIQKQRAAVLRGRVLDNAGNALPGVVVTVLDHPEFGRTVTRADGLFDLVVNGGGRLTLDYQKTGYLPVQRKASAPWRDYAWLPDAIMLHVDAARTTVDLSLTGMQVVQGNPTSDVEGSRQATLLIPTGTQATLHFSDGLSETLTTFHAHITEYSIGADGQKAMPGELPPNSGYTYAVEYTVEEAVEANATHVIFNQPLIHYSQNFIGFPVGFTVPQGYYDRQKGQWTASDSGRVVKVLDIAGGQATLDTTGDNIADSGSDLIPPVSIAERQKLATLYSSGQTLWRVPVTHFSPWDSNWGTSCEGNDCTPPDQPDPDDANVPIDQPQCVSGSVIECENQVLHEYAGVVGTPFTLGYSSDRTRANQDAYALRIPLTGITLPRGIQSVGLTVMVAGRSFGYQYDAAPNLAVVFHWDGQDSRGRTLQGPQPVTTNIVYNYKMVYLRTTRFGYNGSVGMSIDADVARARFSLARPWNGVIGAFDARAFGIGGWSLDLLHYYDPYRRTLYLGNGGRRRTDPMRNMVVSTFAGTGAACRRGDACGDGGPANQATLGLPQSLAVGADGSVYISSQDDYRVRKVSPDGIIRTVAGVGQPCYRYPAVPWCGSGDGGPATQAYMMPTSIALDAAGNLYIADTWAQRIRKVDANGIITTVAGDGGYCSASNCGDGGPATAAQLKDPLTIKFGPDDSLYIGEACGLIRKVELGGTIQTVHARSYGCDATIFDITADGNLYWRYSGLYRISPDGDEKMLVAADWNPGFQYIACITAAPDSSGVYVCDLSSGDSALHNRVYHVTPEGVKSVYAGNGYAYSGDAGLALRAGMNPTDIAFGPDGSAYVADRLSQRVRRITPSMLPGLSSGDMLVVASQDGTEIYVFSSSGRHLRTLDALTQATLYQFAYDAAGYPISITDRYGNTTAIERDANGNATAIVAPFGQRTGLSLDANSYLSAITNPAGESDHYSYTSDGSMLTYTNPRGGVTSFTWDARGRLTQETDAAGGQKVFASADLSNGYKVTLTTSLGRITQYSVQVQPDQSVRRVVTAPDGAQTVSLVYKDASRQVTYPDGTIEKATYGPDPRWGMMAPVVISYTLTTPGGVTYTQTHQRAVLLSTSTNPFSLISLTDTVTINGKVWASAYVSATRSMTTTSPEGRRSTVTFDSHGRIIQAQTADQLPVSYSYDSRGQLVTVVQGEGDTARSLSLSYNGQGFVETLTDAQNRSMRWDYDAAGRPVTQTLPGGRIVRYDYDAAGNMIGITPPGRPMHGFAYSPVDLLSAYHPPAVPNVATPTTTYTHNLDRQLTQVASPDGEMKDIAYDGAGRMSSVTLSRGQVLMGYDPATGKLASLTAPGGIVSSFSYAGALLTGEVRSGPLAGRMNQAYDNNWNVISRSVNGANPIAFQYDNDDLLIRAGALDLNRDARNGLVMSTTLGNILDTRAYNDFGEWAQYTAVYSGTDLYKVQSARDKLGRIAVQTETIQGVTSAFSYTYDIAGRLTGVQKGAVTTGAYTYDDNGNRLSYASPGGTVNGTYDQQDRLTMYGTTTYSYTANGELAARRMGGQSTTYQYDPLGNLIQVTLPDGTHIEYVIDGQNRRMGKKVNGALTQGFLYQDDLKPIAELDGAGNVVSRFVYATRVNAPDYMLKGGVTYRLILDPLGSPRLVVNTATGEVVQRMDYDEFGRVLTDTNPGMQPFGFAGGLYDADTGLVRFGARDYDAQTGRWTAKDPILFHGGDTNLYVYSGNDPVNWVDPAGESECKPKEDPEWEMPRMPWTWRLGIWVGKLWASIPWVKETRQRELEERRERERTEERRVAAVRG